MCFSIVGIRLTIQIIPTSILAIKLIFDIDKHLLNILHALVPLLVNAAGAELLAGASGAAMALTLISALREEKTGT